MVCLSEISPPKHEHNITSSPAMPLPPPPHPSTTSCHPAPSSPDEAFHSKSTSSHSTTSAAPTGDDMIPPRFHACTPHTPHDHSPSLFNPLPARHPATIPVPTSPAAIEPTPPPIAKTATEGDILPDLPAWVLGMLAGCAGFVVVVALVLLLAQFPLAFRWARRRVRMLGKGRGHRYQRIEGEAYEMDDFRRGEGRGFVDRGLGRTSGSMTGVGIKKRSGKTKGKAGQLRVDTAGEYYGLGIAVAGDRCTGRHEGEGDDALRYRLNSPVTARSAYLAAALPSAVSSSRAGWTTSPAKSPLSAVVSSPDVESGDMQSSPLGASSADLLGIDSPLHEDMRSTASQPAHRGALLERVNDAVGAAADTLSRRFHDRVTAPEERLLLPVREGEREEAVVPGVFVG